MNAQERKALKRALESKEVWKNKAKERQKGMRLLQLKIRDLERSRFYWKQKSVDRKDKRMEPEVVLEKSKSDPKKN